MQIKLSGLPIIPQTIMYVKFSALGLDQFKCTSTNTYKKDAEKFASTFKKVKEITVNINVISYHGKEK